MKWFIVVLFLLISVFAQAEEKPLLTLSVLQQEFVKLYPENAAAKERIAAAESKATSEARFMAPEVSLTWDDIPRGKSFSDAERLNYKVTQRFDFPLEQFFSVQAANEETKMVSADLQMKLAEALAVFQRAYFQLVYTRLELKLNHELQSVLSAFVKQSASRYAQNVQQLDEPLEFSLERGALQNEENELQADMREAEAGLQALGHVELLEHYRVPEQFPQMQSVPSEEKFSTFLPQTPWWKLKNSALAAQKKNQQKSRAAFLPDFMVGAEYQQRKLAQDAWSFELGLSIPFAPWSKTYAEERVARKLAQAEVKSRAAEEQHLVHEFSMLRAHMQSHREAALRAKSELVPQSRLLLRTTSARYALNKANVADVLRAYKLYRDAAHQSYEHQYQFWLFQTQLESSLGRPLEDL